MHSNHNFSFAFCVYIMARKPHGFLQLLTLQVLLFISRLQIINNCNVFFFQCSYIPECKQNYTEVTLHIQDIQRKFNKSSSFVCYFDPKGKYKSTILMRKFGPQKMISYFFWPTSMFAVGLCVVIIVKISQYFARISLQAN